MVHSVEAMIMNALETESPISADWRPALVDKVVELIHIEPGTSSGLIHSHLTAALALHILETEGEVATARNEDGLLELRLTTDSSENITAETEPVAQQEAVIGELGATAVSLSETDIDLNPDSHSTINREKVHVG